MFTFAENQTSLDHNQTSVARTMTTNPYQPPRSNPKAPIHSASRIAAFRSLRISLCILLVPGICNFICFQFPGSFGPTGFQMTKFDRTVNLVTLCLTVVSIWFWGLILLERIATLIYWVVGRKRVCRSTLQQWKQQLYQALQRGPNLAFLGAILWVIWIVAIYSLQLDFFSVSLPIGIAAHILAACLYLPLFYSWYRLERER